MEGHSRCSQQDYIRSISGSLAPSGWLYTSPLWMMTFASTLGPGSPYYKAHIVQNLIDYLSDLTVSQGRLAGQPFEVLPWQKRFVMGAFRPGVQSAALSVARGNGKTALLSGIAAATLDGPLAISRGETVIVASSFEQARIAFEHVVAFMGDKLAMTGGPVEGMGHGATGAD